MTEFFTIKVQPSSFIFNNSISKWKMSHAVSPLNSEEQNYSEKVEYLGQ